MAEEVGPVAKAIELAAEEAVFSALEAALEVDSEAELVHQHLEAEFVQQLEADFEIDRHSLEADFLEAVFSAFEADFCADLEVDNLEAGLHCQILETAFVCHLEAEFVRQL